MSTTEQSELSELVPGLYHVVVALSGGNFDGRRLTDAGGHVTIAPPSAHPDPAQQWRVIHVPGTIDVVTIQRPIHAPPPVGIYLGYEGAHHPPKEHAPVVVNRFKTEWTRNIGPGFTNIIRVKDSHLAISVAAAHAPPRPDPPLILGDKPESELKWIFEFVAPHVE